MTQRILGITPARGGSKGVPGKNIKALAGKPLLSWTIEAALKSKRLDRYLVSTEDSEIAQVAQACGAEVLARPEELASDTASSLSVLQQVLEQVPAEIVVLLQATSPIRDEGLIDRCIERFLETQADSLATGFTCKYRPYGSSSNRRQEIPGFFYDDGNVYVVKADCIRANDRFGKRMEQMTLSREENVEIDDPFDFWIAEQIMLRRTAGALSHT